MVERGGAEIQEDNDNRFGDWGISVDNDRLCPFSAPETAAAIHAERLIPAGSTHKINSITPNAI